MARIVYVGEGRMGCKTWREYYGLRGLNRNGIPTKRTLTESGLSDVAEELKQLGRI